MRVEFLASADTLSSPEALLAKAIHTAGVRGHHVTGMELIRRGSGDPTEVVVELLMIGDPAKPAP